MPEAIGSLGRTIEREFSTTVTFVKADDERGYLFVLSDGPIY